jgi:hypothetical protein
MMAKIAYRTKHAVVRLSPTVGKEKAEKSEHLYI